MNRSSMPRRARRYRSPGESGPKYAHRGEVKFCGVRTAAFFCTLGALFVLALAAPRPTHSDFEKRDLAEFPAFSWQSLWDGSFFDGVNLWFSDTFPFRDGFVAWNGELKTLYGAGQAQLSGNVEQGDAIPSVPERPPASAPETSAPESAAPESSAPESAVEESAPESSAPESSAPASSVPEPAPEIDVTGEVTQSLGAVLISGEAAHECYNFSQEVANNYLAMISRASERLGPDVRLYDMVVPTSMDILLPESFRAGLNTSSQKDAIAYLYGSMPAAVRTVPVYDALKAHADEYVYFRTDHHWTALGAYYAYREYAAQAGFTPLELDAFTVKEFPGFLGAFYSDTGRAPALAQNPDTVFAYVPPGEVSMTFTDRDGAEHDWPLIADVSGWASSSKYNTFIGGDNPYTVVHNAARDDGSCCVVVKESFGNAFVPFLAPHYENVYVIDYRYWNGDLATFVQGAGAKDVLFLNNISATRNASLVSRMQAIVG